MTDMTTPIHMLPEVQEKVRKVKQYIDGMLRSKNLFAWKFFIDDLKVDAEVEIYKYEEKYRRGEYKETGVGGYCNLALQLALNYASYYSAQKRKVNFETASLDISYDNEKGTQSSREPADPYNDYAGVEMMMVLQSQLSADIYSLVEKVYSGEGLTEDEFALLRKQRSLKQLLRQGVN